MSIGSGAGSARRRKPTNEYQECAWGRMTRIAGWSGGAASVAFSIGS